MVPANAEHAETDSTWAAARQQTEPSPFASCQFSAPTAISFPAIFTSNTSRGSRTGRVARIYSRSSGLPRRNRRTADLGNTALRKSFSCLLNVAMFLHDTFQFRNRILPTADGRLKVREQALTPFAVFTHLIRTDALE